MPLNEYNKRKELSVDSVSGTPQIGKAQPVIISGETVVQEVDGWEDGDLSSNPQWTELFGQSSIDNTIQSSVVKNGSNALEVSVSSGTSSIETLAQDRGTGSVSDGDKYSTWFRVTGEQIFEFGLGSGSGQFGSGNDFVSVAVDANNDVNISSETQITADVTSISDNEWFRLEIELNPSQSEAVLRVHDTNNSLIADDTVSTNGASAYQYVKIQAGGLNSNSNVNGYFDDVSYSSNSTSTLKDDSKTGNGDIVIDFANISGPEDIAVFDQNDNLLNYEIESLDTVAETAVLWVYKDWVRDGTTQAQLAYGSNVSNTDRQNVTGTWDADADVQAAYAQSSIPTPDRTSNNNDLSVTGGSKVDGEFGEAISYALPDFAEDGDCINTDNAFTISFWYRASGAGNDGILIETRGSIFGTGAFVEYGIGGTGVITFGLQPDSGSTIKISSSRIDDGNYHFVVCRHDTSLQEIELFVDDVSQAKADVSGFGNTESGANIVIGGEGDFEIDGDVDEFKAFSRSLSVEYQKSEFDASPTGGQTFFSQKAAEPLTGGIVTEINFSESLTVNETGELRTEQEHGRFQTPSSNTTITEQVGFKPDVVQFRVTSTNTNFNNVSTGVKADFGWGHGVAKFNEDGTVEEFALSHGSGSNSTNGHLSESTSSFSVFQVVTDSSGDVDEGRVAGSASRTSDGFELSFSSTQEQQQVFYTAYKFTGGSVDVGFFNAPSSTGTKSITEPGFKPNFLRLFATPSLNTMDSVNNELSSGTDVGWGQGVAVENSGGVKQGSLAVSQFSSNIDGHAYTSSDTDVFSIAFMNNKQSLNGTAKGSVTFTNNGFDINFGTVNAPNNETPLTVYLAADSLSEPDAGFEKTPTGTGSVSYSTDTDLDNLCVFSSNTIPAFNQERGVGRQTWGWNYGQLNNATDTQQIGFYSNSNSVNAHAFSADNILYKSIYTNENGAEQGRVEGDISSIGTSSFSINYSTVSTDSANGFVEGDTEAFAYYGFSSGGISDGLGASAQKIVGETLKESFIETFSVFDTQNNATKFLTSLSESISAFADVVSLADAEQNLLNTSLELFCVAGYKSEKRSKNTGQYIKQAFYLCDE